MTAHGFRAMASTLLNETSKWNPDAVERALAHLDRMACGPPTIGASIGTNGWRWLNGGAITWMRCAGNFDWSIFDACRVRAPRHQVIEFYIPLRLQLSRPRIRYHARQW